MNYFRYKLLTPKGNISSGIIKLPYQDVMSAVTHLERDGGMTIYVKKLNAILSYFVKAYGMRSRRRLTRLMQAELLSNMALMLKAGVSLTVALEEASETSEIPEIKSDIKDMITTIQGGVIFSEACRKYPYIFPKTVIHLIRIGEETGQLEKLLKDAADHLRNIQTIISDTKQALMYPSFVMIAMGVLMVFWFYSVVPRILSLFKEMDVALPALTVVLMKISDFLQENIITIAVAIVLFIFTVLFLRKKIAFFRRLIDILLVKAPLTGTIVSASNLAYITEYLSLLLNAGIDILGSMKIIRESVKNEIYREKLEGVRLALIRGSGISEAFTEVAIFPNFVTRMINVGEISGTLTEQLGFIAEEYRQKLSIVVATLGKIIEPLVLVIAGALFAVIIGGLMLPIYDLISKVSG